MMEESDFYMIVLHVTEKVDDDPEGNGKNNYLRSLENGDIAITYKNAQSVKDLMSGEQIFFSPVTFQKFLNTTIEYFKNDKGTLYPALKDFVKSWNNRTLPTDKSHFYKNKALTKFEAEYGFNGNKYEVDFRWYLTNPYLAQTQFSSEGVKYLMDISGLKVNMMQNTKDVIQRTPSKKQIQERLVSKGIVLIKNVLQYGNEVYYNGDKITCYLVQNDETKKFEGLHLEFYCGASYGEKALTDKKYGVYWPIGLLMERTCKGAMDFTDTKNLEENYSKLDFIQINVDS